MFREEDVIFRYTRAQAIEDGVLVDVSATAREAGIRYPVAVTARLWAEVVTPDEEARTLGQSEEGRLWDVLWVFRSVARGAPDGQGELHFRISVLQGDGRHKEVTLKAHCGPGDDLEPVVTIMMPDED